MTGSVLANSTFLDFTSYGTTQPTTIAEAYGVPVDHTAATSTVNVALVFSRANDPTALLTSDWATRQNGLAQLGDDLWKTYGASGPDYQKVMAGLKEMGIVILGDAAGSDGYITSQESRTIWVSLTPENFQALFGTQAFADESTYLDSTLYYWEGGLALPDGWNVTGLWFDTSPIWGVYPAVSDLSGGAVANPPQGAQSIGNQLTALGTQTNNYAGDIAKWFYNFPLAGVDAPTATVGLIEPGIGDQLSPGGNHTFQQGLDNFRASAGIATAGSYYTVANNGLNYFVGNSSERSLDVGVVTSANPNSTMGLYGGSGFGNNAQANAYTAYQAAFWDPVNAPPVVTSSFGIFQQPSPDSPFARAVRELFVDGALANITTFLANNDWGSSYNFGNGIANQNAALSSPYAVLVGGTSLTTLASAPLDSTVASTPSPAGSLYGLAMAGDPGTLWQLAAGGLVTMPSSITTVADTVRFALLESVWNVYALSGQTLDPGIIDLTAGGSSDGGVDTTQPTPWYQTDFGLTPTSVNPGSPTGRGAPDVAALAGGNMLYNGPPPDLLDNIWNYWGTSASTPLWASLAAQIDTVFVDQGLPHLGFINDLLYTAAAVSPAAFNDITFGNNISSYVFGGPIDSNGVDITLTGLGYNATSGYDLTTGLGSPNGLLLARSLSAIAHSQSWYEATPDILVTEVGDDWQTLVDQSLLFQTATRTEATVSVTVDDASFGFDTSGSSEFAWTSRLAQQSLQPDFDPNLVRLFDGAAQGAVRQASLAAGDVVDLTVNAVTTTTPQGALTDAFGFVDFAATGEGIVRVARPVAVAELAGGFDDQQAVVRLRQNGSDSLSVTLYRVDDFDGAIGDLLPGDAGYATAAAGRAYATEAGSTAIAGPGFGKFGQVLIDDVDAGDIIAMILSNLSTGATYWSFAAANESIAGVDVAHLWNYGLNTWGWEDTYGGGDHDYNDLVIGVDFTSASGSQWLV